MNQLITKEYLGNIIEFKVIDGHVYANANKMADSFENGNQKLKDWKRSSKTKEYIKALEKSNKNKLWENSTVSTEGRNGGTWIHEKLILNFARYLNVEFEIWCDEQIETLLREGHVKIKKEYKKLADKTPIEILEDNGKALNNFFENLGINIPKEIIGDVAVNSTAEMTGYKFNEIKILLNKQHKEDYHTGSYITKKFNIKRNRTNETFTLLGLQTKGSTSMQPYVLTQLGKKYGVERTYTNNKHQGYEIKWKDCVIEYIKENIKDIPIEWIKK